MKILDIIPQSCFITIGTVKDIKSVDSLQEYLSYSLEFIKQFKVVVVSINSLDGVNLECIELYKKTWESNVQGVEIIYTSVNKGHMFGTIDLEERALLYVKNNFPEIKYVFKSMEDFIIAKKFVDTEIEDADFYYLPGFSTESVMKAKSKDYFMENYESFEDKFWTPQTTFFILDITKISNFYGDDVEKKYLHYLEIKSKNPKIKPWEVPFDIKFDCESHLGRTTKDLKKSCIVKKEFDALVEFSITHGIGDPSHKNILFSRPGLCHYHFLGNTVYTF